LGKNANKRFESAVQDFFCVGQKFLARPRASAAEGEQTLSLLNGA
jgi:hypothetical protein